jgi:hypothetical protein
MLDRMTEKPMAEAIGSRGDVYFAKAMAQVHKSPFGNLIVDARTVHTLKTNRCLLTNPHYQIEPIVPALEQNVNWRADDSMVLFVEFFSSLNGSPIVICSVIIDSLFTQSHRLDRVLDQSIVLWAKYFALYDRPGPCYRMVDKFLRERCSFSFKQSPLHQ